MQPTALLVIDVQQSFEHMPFWSEDGLVTYQSKQNALIAHARKQSWPVIFIYHQSRGAFSAKGGLLGPMAWVDRQAGDPVFYKHVHNALSESGLEPFLYANGISRLVVSGIRTEQCCETTARFASDSGYEVEFVLDATHTFSMTLPNGEKASTDSIKLHTSMVLSGRFATIWDTEDFISRAPLITINSRCPRSGGLVSEDSLTDYNGVTVGFCNTGCRDSFAGDQQAFGADRLYFDKLIARQTIAQAYI
ncbi:MAG: isochorismatase family protein [Granulosicoccus sp.]